MRIKRATKRASVIGAALFSLFVSGLIFPTEVRPDELEDKMAELQRKERYRDELKRLLDLGKSGQYFLLDLQPFGKSTIVRKDNLLLYLASSLYRHPKTFSKEELKEAERSYENGTSELVGKLEAWLPDAESCVAALKARIAELESRRIAEKARIGEIERARIADLERWPTANPKERAELLSFLDRRRNINNLLKKAESGYFLYLEEDDIKARKKEEMRTWLWLGWCGEVGTMDPEILTKLIGPEMDEVYRKLEKDTQTLVKRLQEELLELERRLDNLSAKIAEAQRPPQQQTPPPQQAGGRTGKDIGELAGFVVDANKQLVEGARVAITDSARAGTPATLTTDVKGRFQQYLPPGTYQVEASSPAGYEPPSSAAATMQVTMGRRTSVLLILTARKPEENKSGLKANLTVTVTDVRLSVNPGSEWRCDWTAVFTEHNGVGVTLTEMILGDTCTNPSIRRSADTAPMNIRIEAGQTTRSPFKMRVRDRRAGPDTHATAVRQYHGKDDNGNEVVVEYSVSK